MKTIISEATIPLFRRRRTQICMAWLKILSQNICNYAEVLNYARLLYTAFLYALSILYRSSAYRREDFIAACYAQTLHRLLLKDWTIDCARGLHCDMLR